MSQTVSPEARVGQRAEQKRRWDRENYVASTRRRDARDARRREIYRLFHQGCALREIASEIGTTTTCIANTISRMRRDGWDLPKRGPFGWPR